jgi:hypothetical protein
MTSPAATESGAGPAPARRSTRVWNGVVGVWAGVTGLAPHVLHHVGPLAGAALLAGAGGQLLFGGIGFVAMVPFLLRLRRRFSNWWAPGIALSVFVVVYTVSTLVVGPLVSGGGDDTSEAGTESHLEHHEPRG